MAGIVILYGKNTDGTFSPIDVDQFSNALSTIAMEHSRLHDGEVFNFSSKLSIVTTGVSRLLGRVGDKEVHFQSFSVGATDGPIDIQLFEGPTITAVGAAQTVRNRNRDHVNGETMGVYAGTTVSNDGDELFINGVMASSQGSRNFSSRETSVLEWILKPNTDYIIKMTNNGSGTAVIYAGFIWYERDPT